MSSIQSYSIKCPKCGVAQQVDLYDSINVGETPELRDRLMANQLNAVTCPDCEFSFRVDKRLLYNDPAQRLMVFCFPGGEQEFDKSLDDYMSTMEALREALPPGFDPPAVHLVFSRTELVERIFLVEHGLDERIIEYIKYMMYSRNAEKLDPKEKAILFNAEDSNDKALCFVVQDLKTMQLEGMLEFERSAYDGLAEMFDSDEKTASLMDLFPGPYISARGLLLQGE